MLLRITSIRAGNIGLPASTPFIARLLPPRRTSLSQSNFRRLNTCASGSRAVGTSHLPAPRHQDRSQVSVAVSWDIGICRTPSTTVDHDVAAVVGMLHLFRHVSEPATVRVARIAELGATGP